MNISDIEIGGWIYSGFTKRFFKVTGITTEFIFVYRSGSAIKKLHRSAVSDDYNHVATKFYYVSSDKEKLMFLLKYDEAR
jgi:hypothetical protein